MFETLPTTDELLALLDYEEKNNGNAFVIEALIAAIKGDATARSFFAVVR